MSFEDSYVDANTGVIQASSRVQLLGGAGTLPNEDMCVRLGPQDVTHITGLNNLFLNWARFQFKGVGVNGGVGSTSGYMTPGILPRDLGIEGTNLVQPVSFPLWALYDDVRGWPLNKGKQHYYAYTGDTGNSGNRINMSFTYTPKSALLLNREQVLYLAVHNSYGQAFQGVASIVASFKRGPE